MSAAPLRVGVIGLGEVGRRHLAAFAGHPDCEVRAICDLDPAALRAAGAEAPGAVATERPGQVLAAPDLDALAIASFDAVHGEQVVQALRRGRHAFVEKPLCTDGEELAAIAAAAREHPDAVVASNLVLRGAPLWQRLRGEIAAGDLGEVYAFDGDYLYGRLHKITEGWRGRAPGYSVMLGGGVHLVDLMIWLLGERPVSVSAAGSDVATRGTGFRGHDFVAATFSFASGRVGRVTANFASVHRHQHAVRAFGTRGTVLVDEWGARRYRRRDPGGPAEVLADDPLPDGKSTLVPAFVDAALGRAAADPGLDHELAVVAACLAADESLASGGSSAVLPQGFAARSDHM